MIKAGFQSEEYDLIAIGSGPAGESATELASFRGLRSLIVEHGQPGGTVTTTGGVPTKTLREAALYFSGFRDRDVYGLRMETQPGVALDHIRKRTWEVCEALQRLTAKNIADRGVDYLVGTARLGQKGTVLVKRPDGRETVLRAKIILLATGSQPCHPEVLPRGHPGIFDTDTILSRGHPPKRLLILGGGAVAVEFATIAHALDIEVTIVDKSERLLKSMDEEVSCRLTALLEAWGIAIHPGITVRAANPVGEELDVELSSGARMRIDTILVAAGRSANTSGLRLAEAGVRLNNRGRVEVDSQFRTSCDGIYAAGDVIGPTLASVAMEQGRSAVCHAFDFPSEGFIDPTPVSAVYGMPEAAGAGLTERQCRDLRLEYGVGRCELEATPRGAIAGRRGLLKLIFNLNDRRLIGVHCLGDIASEIVGIGQMAIRCGATLDTIATLSMNTPTYSYAYKYAAFDGLRRLMAGKDRRFG